MKFLHPNTALIIVHRFLPVHLHGIHRIVKFENTVFRLNFPLSLIFSHDLDILIYLFFLFYLQFTRLPLTAIFLKFLVYILVWVFWRKPKFGELLTPKEGFQLQQWRLLQLVVFRNQVDLILIFVVHISTSFYTLKFELGTSKGSYL